MSELEPSTLDKLFARLRVAFGGEELPLRRRLALGGAVAIADLGEVDEEFVVTCDTNLASQGQVIVSGDANHTVTPTELLKLVFKCSGATVDRNLLFPMPTTAPLSYKRIVRVMDGDAGGRVVTIGAGATVRVPPGLALQLLFTPDGVFSANTAAPAESERVIDPHWLFAVDFDLLELGGHAAVDFFAETAAQTTNRGLTFARASAATVQTGPHSWIGGLGADAARIGTADGAKTGLVIEPPRINGCTKAGASFARDFQGGTYASPHVPRLFYDDLGHTADDMAQSQPGTVTSDAAVGPDGLALADRLVIVGGPRYTGGGAHLGQNGPWMKPSIFNIAPLTFSTWFKGTAGTTHRLTWMERIPWDQGGGLGQSATHVAETVFVATGEWERHSVSRPGGVSGLGACVINEGTDRSQDEGSAIGALSSTAYIDGAQLEVDGWVGELILAGDGLCAADRLSYAHGDELGAAGRMRLLFGFYPKHHSSEQVSGTQDISSASAESAFTLYSWMSGGSRIFGEIIQGGVDSYKLRFNAVEAPSTFRMTVETISWAKGDFVELFVEVGGALATKVKYRKNGSAWIVLTDLAALTTVTPTGDVDFAWSGIDDIRTPAWRLRRLYAYDAAGAP